MWLEQLLEFLKAFWEQVLPWVVLDEYEQGVVLVLGRYDRTLGPGLHFKGPFVTRVLTENIKLQTLKTEPQTLPAKDDVEVTISCVVRYVVEDVRTCLIEVDDAIDSLDELVMSAVRSAIVDKKWEEIRQADLDNQIAIKSRALAKRWGIRIDTLSVANLSRRLRTIRLMGVGMGGV